ncbi:type IV secretion system protein [Achromobacter sp. GG226]|uniref:virB8 family protein n=1 Tax=Verticiella alkaliphila TaxID=2779529 RepID=UPI001C0E329E|nr:type IV secretion system protein [Verticiella sp. GG226]MBU4610311.1 type IV secretion system protein [Verticiella sp. GG226]
MTTGNTSPTVKVSGIRQYLRETQGLERDVIYEVARSRRTAWILATAALLMAAMAIAALLALTPLKTVAPPIVLRVDSTTGTVAEMTTLGDVQLTPSEAEDQANIYRYVLACESYNWYSLASDYETCGALSSAEVQRQYVAQYQGKDALHNQLGSRVLIRVRVGSITPAPHGAAVIRFTVQRQHDDGIREPAQHKIATLTYSYDDAAQRRDDRWLNPRGFLVTSYRSDNDLVAQH